MKSICTIQHKLTKEVYCPYELAILLKEAGFKWKCRGYFYKDDDSFKFGDCSNDDEKIASPTIDVAVRWLRVEKNLPIQMIYSFVKDEWASCVNEKYYWSDTYYGSIAEGIVQCLNIILGRECQIKFV